MSWKKLGGGAGLAVLFMVAAGTLRFGLWFLALMGAMLGVFAGGQYWLRARAATRRASGHANGSGYWRMWVYSDWHLLLGEARRGTDWLYLSMAPVTVASDPSGLTFAPTAFGAKVCGYRPAVVPWTDIVGVTSRDLGRTTPDGKLSFTPRTELTLNVRGELVPWWRQRDWQAALDAKRTPQDEPLDADELADLGEVVTMLREDDDTELDQTRIVLVTDGPDGFAEQVRLHARP